MQIGTERTTESYNDNTDQDIKFVEKNENSKKIFQKTKWRTIYEVTDADYIQNSNIFPTNFFPLPYVLCYFSHHLVWSVVRLDIVYIL